MKQLIEDASGFSGHAEEVYTPTTEAEVVDVLKLGVPITVLGSGTGVTGGRVPFDGSALSLEKFNKLEIHPGYAVVGAAVWLRDLHKAAAASGQLYAPDPTETSASIGGTISCNASGSRSFLYGDTRRHVRAVRVAMMDGSVHTFRRGEKVPFEVPAVRQPATTKFSAGYKLSPDMDWVDLFVGSEGTLGVVLEAEMQLLPAPTELFTGVIFFGDEDRAIDAVEAWRGEPDTPIF
jgi:FAD/FMN-containing dehydrogenase